MLEEQNGIVGITPSSTQIQATCTQIAREKKKEISVSCFNSRNPNSNRCKGNIIHSIFHESKDYTFHLKGGGGKEDLTTILFD